MNADKKNTIKAIGTQITKKLGKDSIPGNFLTNNSSNLIFNNGRQRRYSVEITRVKARLDGKTYSMPSNKTTLKSLLYKLFFDKQRKRIMSIDETCGVLSVRSPSYNKVVVVFFVPRFCCRLKHNGKFTIDSGSYEYTMREL